MTEQRILLLVLITSVSNVLMQSPGTDGIQNQCPIEARVNLTGGTLDPVTGIMVKSGYLFPLDSRWNEGNETFGCACYSRSICLPVYCPSEMNMYLKVDQDCNRDSFYLYDDEEPEFSVFSIDMLNKSIVVSPDNVHVKSEYGLCFWMLEPLMTVKFATDGFLIRNNGSIYLPQNNISTMYNFDRFCLCSLINFKIYKPTCESKEDDSYTTHAFVENKANFRCDKNWIDLYMDLLILIAIKWISAGCELFNSA